MAQEPADVLIIGAGASGGVVAKRLAAAGFKVVCLEQGRWHDRSEYRGAELDWELTMRKQWSTSPNVRETPDDYPIDETNAEISPLMFAGVGGSMIIFAGAWPRMLPSDFRVRSLDGIADDWPLTSHRPSRKETPPWQPNPRTSSSSVPARPAGSSHFGWRRPGSGSPASSRATGTTAPSTAARSSTGS